jgi:hypothetical protein
MLALCHVHLVTAITKKVRDLLEIFVSQLIGRASKLIDDILAFLQVDVITLSQDILHHQKAARDDNNPKNNFHHRHFLVVFLWQKEKNREILLPRYLFQHFYHGIKYIVQQFWVKFPIEYIDSGYSIIDRGDYIPTMFAIS